MLKLILFYTGPTIITILALFVALYYCAIHREKRRLYLILARMPLHPELTLHRIKRCLCEGYPLNNAMIETAIDLRYEERSTLLDKIFPLTPPRKYLLRKYLIEDETELVSSCRNMIEPQLKEVPSLLEKEYFQRCQTYSG